jgi:gas vesicle protein
MIHRRNRNGRKFIVGTLVGIIAGFAGGTALLRSAETSEETIEVIDERADGTTEAFAEMVRESTSTTQDQLRTMVNALTSRWRRAMREGKAAAADRERELEARLAFESKRVPAFEGELIEKIEAALSSDDQSRPPDGTASST